MSSDAYTKKLLNDRREAEAKRAREAQLYLDKLHDEQLRRRGETRPATKVPKVQKHKISTIEEDSLEEDIPFALALEKLDRAKQINQVEDQGTVMKPREIDPKKFNPTAPTSIRDQQLKRLKKGGRRTRKRTTKRKSKRTTKRKSKRTTKRKKTTKRK